MLKTEKECIEYIHSLGKFGKKSGLDNITRLCDALGNPESKIRAIHIAGTNGKGSVSCMVSSMLKTRYKVGLYTSPYIELFNERIQINGKNISSEKLISYTNRVKNACDSIPDFYPIEFEFITAMGFLFFAEENCDVVVLETGLGGRLDSTNIVKNPLCCAICAIGMDHVSILGDTIEKIAAEKAGIIKEGVPVALFHDMAAPALDVISRVCAEKAAPIVSDVSLGAENVSRSLDGSEFTYKGVDYRLSLAGEYQTKNALTALDIISAVSDVLPLALSDICEGLRCASWKCRFEVLGCEKGIMVLDGAHNSHGVTSLVNEVNNLLGDYKKTFVFGMLNDKDFEDTVEQICSADARIIVTDVPSYRQTDSRAVFNCAQNYCPDSIYISDCRKAVDYAWEHNTEGGAVCVFGSLYLVGEVRAHCLELTGK
ncbi:MAG: bifunctional folylpolyglutamate synthase/dihydrofolate synthase [Clostridia bacterium]|nr:bifunctional folylpolyglutamate synthase/dihydrofolate synthase [Clostridia bacterium]